MKFGPFILFTTSVGEFAKSLVASAPPLGALLSVNMEGKVAQSPFTSLNYILACLWKSDAEGVGSPGTAFDLASKYINGCRQYFWYLTALILAFIGVFFTSKLGMMILDTKGNPIQLVIYVILAVIVWRLYIKVANLFDTLKIYATNLTTAQEDFRRLLDVFPRLGADSGFSNIGDSPDKIVHDLLERLRDLYRAGVPQGRIDAHESALAPFGMAAACAQIRVEMVQGESGATSSGASR